MLDTVGVLAPQEQQEDHLDVSLRPTRLHEYIGQPDMRRRLAVAISAAGIDRRPLGHLLLSGPAGLGKTTMAAIIANEMGTRMVAASGTTLTRPYDLVGILKSLARGDVFFIDECHALPRVVEEYLYTAMEDFYVDIVFGEGLQSRSERIQFEPFTLVGATTLEGNLSKPFRERFDLAYELDLYSGEELTIIVMRSAALLGLDVTEEAARTVAFRSRGTPRIANRLLRRVRDYATVARTHHVGERLADRSLRAEGVDVLGLDETDRRYLGALRDRYKGRQVGIGVLASALGIAESTLTDKVEAWLVRCAYVERERQGRQITDAGRRALAEGTASLHEEEAPHV